MTGTGERYLLRQMLAVTGTASLFLTGTPPIRQDLMNRTLASADTAHYYLRPAQLSTLPTARRVPLWAGPPGITAVPTARVPVVPDPGRLRARPAPGPTVAGSDPNTPCAGDRCPHRTP